MLLIAGILVSIALAMVGFGVVLALLTWIVVKWMFIAAAIAGGVLGYWVFESQVAVILGAVSGVLFVIFAINHLDDFCKNHKLLD